MALTARRRAVTAYKVLGMRQESHHGGTGRWVKNRWRTVDGPLIPCGNGIHYCRRDQLIRWLGPTIWLFEDGTPDETLDAGDKMVTRKGRVTERVEAWTPELAQQVCYAIADHAVRVTAADALDAAGLDASGLRSLEQIVDERTAGAASNAAGAASNAAVAASYAAGAARYAAGGNAAWAARYAAGAAGYAAGAASNAAEAASNAAEAASNAAWAARNAAWAARNAHSTEILFDYLEGRRS